MDVWDAWVELVCWRNKFCHAARVIQRSARTCLYEPQCKKGRERAMRLWDELGHPSTACRAGSYALD
jgi:hypothetical protein